MISRDDHTAAGSAGTPSTPGREPFERWLDTKLKKVYGSVLAEPIPDELLDMLRKKLDSQ